MEIIETTYLEVKKTARISTYGVLSSKTKYCWIVLHGSNMLCEQMLFKFSDFDPETHFVIAPESLLRFYANKFGGDVVASWMTKRDRLYEIDDISNYLNEVWNVYTSKLSSDCKKIVMGFSQGGTMCYRWLHHSKVDLNYLLIYAGWIPEEIDLSMSQTELNNIKTLYAFGNSDQFFTPDTMKKVEANIEKNKLQIEICSYDGDHRVDRGQLHYLFEKYIK